MYHLLSERSETMRTAGEHLDPSITRIALAGGRHAPPRSHGAAHGQNGNRDQAERDAAAEAERSRIERCGLQLPNYRLNAMPPGLVWRRGCAHQSLFKAS